MPDTTVNHKGNEYVLTRRKLREGDLYLAEYTEPLGEVLTCSFLVYPELAWVLEPVIPPVPNDGKPMQGLLGDWFEFTGEYRNPKDHEEFYYAYTYDQNGPRHGRTDEKQHIMRKVEKPEAPKGYKHTDEYRTPVVGETYINTYNDGLASLRESEWNPRTGNTNRWILRKVEPPKRFYFGEGRRADEDRMQDRQDPSWFWYVGRNDLHRDALINKLNELHEAASE